MRSTLLAIAAFIPATLLAQWTTLTSGTTKELKSVYFSDNNTGWVSGEDGTIKKTTDGGTTWTALTSGTTKDIYGSFFISATTGWVVGESGIVRKTTDGGTTWVAQTSGTTAKLSSVHFFDANTGIAVGAGGVVLTTSNGGTTWTPSLSGFRTTSGSGSGSGSSTTYHDLNHVQMVNSTTAYAAGAAGVFLKSTNKGTTWTAQTSGTTSDLTSFHYTTATDGFVVYKTGGVKYMNGAGTFTSVTAATSKDLLGTHFVSATTGWVVGKEGRILCTKDKGTTWISQNMLTVTQDLNAVYFPTSTAGYVVGKSGVILKSGGLTNSTLEINTPQLTGVSVYPNPATNVINIATGTNVTNLNIQITDVAGKVVIQEAATAVNGMITYPVSNWMPGMYMVNVSANGTTSAFRFVKN